MELIDREKLKASIRSMVELPNEDRAKVIGAISRAKAVDAVEVETLESWLYEIAINNTDNYLGDACEDIIGRLDGLRAFARERRMSREAI